MSNRLKKPKCPPASKPEMPPTRATPAPSGSRSLLHAPPEIQAAYDEGRKMMEAIKADWDKLRDEAYEKRFNDPAVVEQDEKAH